MVRLQCSETCFASSEAKQSSHADDAGWSSGSSCSIINRSYELSVTTPTFTIKSLYPPKVSRGGAAAARLAHNQEVLGSSPSPATK
jgi:hypothetical protein